ncbi:MAG: hypothetical protein Phog2KO_00700 [Phototrophicaceae bacterium]
MVRIWQHLIFTIIISAFMTFFVGAQDDVSPTPQGNIITVSSAFVRSGPSNDYIAVGALYEGDTVSPLNISEDGLWILIPYSRSNGWIQRNLVSWEDEAELNQLPVLSANITPTPRVAITNTPFVPTATPEGNYVNVEGAASAYLRAGPGRGYLRLGQLLPGETVEAISRNENTTWIMIRYSDDDLPDEFAWVAIELVYWEDYQALSDLPVINAENLTPTVTLTPSQTPSITATTSATFTSTPEPTATHTATFTSTPEPTATQTSTYTPEPTPTLTDLPTSTTEATATLTAVPSNTVTSSSTPEPTLTNTLTNTPTNTAQPTATSTLTATLPPTLTDVPTATLTDIPSNTATPEPTHTSTSSATPQPTNTEVQEVAIVASATDIPAHTATATATTTPSETVQITDIFAVQGTSVAVEATNSALNINTDDADIIEEPTESNSISIPFEAIVGVIILLIVLSYIWFYWQGLRAIGRYDNGFVISDCPVCKRGSLSIEARNARILGIPSVKRTIRCDECRSILRETGTKRWRYAVDRIENSSLFDRFNGREVSDADLQRLEKIAPQGASPKTSPEFLDNDTED